MPERIKQHFVQQKFIYTSLLCIVAILVGGYLSLFSHSFVSANVSGVTASDSDTTGFGLDGRDISMSWTPGAEPAGFESLHFFLTPDDQVPVLSTSTIFVDGCMLFTCFDVGFTHQYSQSSFTLPDFADVDSTLFPFTTTSFYTAWVYTSSTEPTLASSSPFLLTSDAPSDTDAPFIEHLSVHTAFANTTGTLYAFVFDDQVTYANFATTTDGGSDNFLVHYGSDVSSSAVTSSAIQDYGSLFLLEIPPSIVGNADNTFEYFLSARDKAGNTTYFCASESASTQGECEATPFVVTTQNAGVLNASGTVDNIADGVSYPILARVFAGGYALPATSTDFILGTYLLEGIPINSAVDIVASAEGYCKNARFEVFGGLDKTNLDLTLSGGFCGFFGEDGEGGQPIVVFSGPRENASNVKVDDSIRVGFSQGLNSTTVDDFNPTDATDSVYLTTDDGTTKVAGSVIFCADDNAPGCSSLFSEDQNVILFDPTLDLTTSTFYTLVMTSGVTAQNGQNILGNRQGGGHEISFTTNAGSINFDDDGFTFGDGGLLPPFVRSMLPAPGETVGPNTNILLEFNDPLSSATVNTTNFTLVNVGTDAEMSLSSVSLDNNTGKTVTLDPASNLTDGEYEVRVLGAVATIDNITMRRPDQTAQIAFRNTFSVGGSADTTPPTIYPELTSGATGVSVNNVFEFGFLEPLSVSTISSSNITLKRGSNPVAIDVGYDPGQNAVFVRGNDVLAPNTVYTVTFGTGVQDLSGNALSSAQSFVYTTGGADTAVPSVQKFRCDDYTCFIEFDEAMNEDNRTGDNFAGSVLNHNNVTVTSTSQSADAVVTSTGMSYDGHNNTLTMEGLSLTAGENFSILIENVVDLSDNSVTSGFKYGTIENSHETFGFSDDGGMFGPPRSDHFGDGGQIGGGEFKPEGFGEFTGEQLAFGQTNMAWPDNPTAGQDSGEFHIRINPGIVLQDNDVLELVFPRGTTLTSGQTMQNVNSPFFSNMVEGSGTVTSTEVLDASNRTLSYTLHMLTAPSASSTFGVDLINVINPVIPKSFDNGYQVDIEVIRGGTTILSKETMPYPVFSAGSNSVVVNVVAGSSTSSPTIGADGSVFLYGGGPSGSLNKTLTLANGVITEVNGVTTGTMQYFGLQDGCYFFGTEPLVTLDDANDYLGSDKHEPICVFGGEVRTTDVLLSACSAATCASLDVSLSGVDFGTQDVDVVAGGPGRFVVRTFTPGNTVSSPSNTIIRLPANGTWFVGVEAARSHTSSDDHNSAQLPGISPGHAAFTVSGIGTSPEIAAAFDLPEGVSYSVGATNAALFTFGTANRTVSGVLQDDNGNVLQDIEVSLIGKGVSVRTDTDTAGAFSLSVSSYGSYGLKAEKSGVGEKNFQIELRDDGSSGTDLYFLGQKISEANPLVIKIKKPAYYISGKVLDSDGNGVNGAEVSCSDANGNTTIARTSNGGSYTAFVDDGVFTCRVLLGPADSSGSCSTSYSKSVTVSGADKTNQNISPTAATCQTLSGKVSVDGTSLAGVPVFVEEWSDGPVSLGFHKFSSADSNGNYSIKVPQNKTVRVGTWHPDYGELAATKAIVTSDVTQNISVTAANATFQFTGGASGMDAMIHLGNATDGSKKIVKQQNGLESDVVISVESGETYDYFVDVFGFGDFSGTIVAGATAVLDLSGIDFITVTGTIKDASDNAITGALVNFKQEVDSGADVIRSATTDSLGNYTMKVKAGTYTIGAAIAGYVPGQAATAGTFSASTTGYDFGGADPDQPALSAAAEQITGTLYSSEGGTVDDGFVWGINDNGNVVKTPVKADGSYELPVTSGNWQVKAIAPRHTEKTIGTIASGATGNDATLTADATKDPSSSTGIVAGNTGGTINDGGSTGIKATFGSGVLQTGSGDVTLKFEKTFTAADAEGKDVLGNAVFKVSATGDAAITELNGNAELEFDYSELVSDLPAGVNEEDLSCEYYSDKIGDWVPSEGGFTVDPTNNKITCLVSHLTDFSVTYTPAAAGSSGGSSSSGSASGGGAFVGASPPTVIADQDQGFLINGGATSTVSRDVVLTFHLENATLLAMSHSPAFDASFDAYVSSSPWILTEGNGVKTVYVKARSEQGGTITLFRTITLTGQAFEHVEEIVEAACALTKGAAYKTLDSAAVYYVTDECTKRPFRGPAIFFSYFVSWGDIIIASNEMLDTISDDAISFMPWGPRHVAQSGSVVKTITDPQVFLLFGGSRHAFSSPIIFDTLGFMWEWIEDVSNAFIDKYEEGSAIEDTRLDGTFFKYEGDSTVYKLDNDKKRRVDSVEIIEAAGYRIDRITQVDSSEVYEDGEPYTLENARTK